jgi:hypothetical protein
MRVSMEQPHGWIFKTVRPDKLMRVAMRYVCSKNISMFEKKLRDT